MSAPFPRLRDWWLLAAGLILFFGWFLGSRGLNEPDEGRYANVALTMAQPGGDWWEPRESGFGHYDKPPLIYWATAFALRTFGRNEWALRLPSLVGAFLALAGLAWASIRLHGRAMAWWAVLICGTCVQFWTLGRVLSPDALLSGWCTLAVAAWLECRHRHGAWAFWIVSLCFWTLAWWTKATPSLVVLAGIFIGTFATNDRAGRRALRLPLLFPLVLVCGSPWYVSMLLRYPELRGFFFDRQLVQRMVGRADGRNATALYYIPVSLVGWLPWWPFSLWHAWRRRPLRDSFADWRRRLGVEGWIVIVGLILFSLANSKLATYTLALAPWAALLLARGLVAGIPARVNWPRLLPAFGFVVFALCAVSWAQTNEAKLGSNSSLREVCAFLRAHHANEVDADHYWPGMAFYLGDVPVHYIVHLSDSRQERPSDSGALPGRFIDPMDWLGQPERPGATEPAFGEHWLIRFRKNHDSPFDPALKPHQIAPVVTIGDFGIFHVTLVAGGPAEAAPAPADLAKSQR